MAKNSVEKLAKELDEKLEKHLESLPKSEYKRGLTEENWEEEIEKIPLLMTGTPTAEQIANSPDLQALQALQYADEDDTPEEQAKTYKDDGNIHFQRKHYKKAVKAYTEGVKVKCSDTDLNTVLYTNRAAANFHLGNHRSSLNDAREAVKLKPAHVKALLRAAQCCMKLKEYTECIKWCDEGLELDSNDKKFLDIRVLATKEKKAIEKDRRKRKAAEKKELARVEKIMMVIKERKVKFAALPSEDGEKEDEEDLSKEKLEEARIMAALATSHVSGAAVELDEEGNLIWPVRFLYPEYSQTDFIEAFSENSRFQDHLEVMFGMDEVIPWDENKVYTLDNLEVYYEDIAKRELVRINPRNTVKKVLQSERYQVVGNTPTFIILSKASPFRDDYMKKYAR